MSAIQLENVACGVCGSGNSQVVARSPDFEYRTSDIEYSFWRCLECSNVFLNPRPAVSSLSIIYPSNYYSYLYDKAVHPIARAIKGWMDRRKVMAWINGRRDFTGLAALDVGCGNGHVMRLLHSLGARKADVWGTELGGASLKNLAAEGFQTYSGSIEEFAESNGHLQFDLVCALQVLEHVADPASFVRAVNRVLKPGGVFVCETPSTDGLDFRLFARRYWGGYHVPRHWNLMNARCLLRLVKSSGLELRRTRYLPAHSFWIFSLHHVCADRKWGALQRFFNPLRNLVLLAFFTAFDLTLAKLSLPTSNIQVIARKPL